MPIRHGGRLASRVSTCPRDHFCRSTIAPRRSWPTTWNEFLPISMPITAIALLSFSDMACSLTLVPRGQFRLLAGAGARPDHPISRHCHLQLQDTCCGRGRYADRQCRNLAAGAPGERKSAPRSKCVPIGSLHQSEFGDRIEGVDQAERIAAGQEIPAAFEERLAGFLAVEKAGQELV